MGEKKKALDLDKIGLEEKRKLASLSEENALILQAELKSQPNFIKASWEKVYENGNDAFIVITKDRPGGRESGYGGRGDTGAGAIDLVVGRQEMANATAEHWCDPNFKTDAARIYISQKTDLDDNFNLCYGEVGAPTAMSGIGIKADGVRIIGRQGIKLITTTDTKNSKGGQTKSWGGIDLIAGNDDSDLQPLVKGDNLVAALETLVGYIDSHIETFASFVKAQMKINLDQASFNNAIQLHAHPHPMGPTLPSTTFLDPKTNKIIFTAPTELFNQASDTVVSTVNAKTNLVMFKSNKLQPWCGDYILSKNNYTN